MERGGVDPLFRNLGVRGECSASLLGRCTPNEKSSVTTEHEVGWFLGRSRRCGEEKNISSLRGIETQFLWIRPRVG